MNLYTKEMQKWLVGIAFLGLLVSGYLFIEYASPNPIPCVSGRGCEVARASIYSSFLGIPTPAYGIIYYLALGFIGALWSDETKKKLTPFLIALVGSAVAVSAFLTYVEAYVIHAWCSWCVMSAILTLAAAIVTCMLVVPRNTSN